MEERSHGVFGKISSLFCRIEYEDRGGRGKVGDRWDLEGGGYTKWETEGVVLEGEIVTEGVVLEVRLRVFWLGKGVSPIF